MVTAGVDVGARTVEVVLLRDGEVVGRGLRLAGHAAPAVARGLLAEVLADAGLARGDLDRVAATGSWRERVDCDATAAEAEAVARGAVHLLPGVRTVVEVGAEEGRAARIGERGEVVDAATAEACAAGSGTFAETMAGILAVPVEELGALALHSTGTVPLSAQCVVFAEREAVALLRDGAPAADIARAVLDGLAARVASLVRKLGYRAPVVLVGGVAYNGGFAAALVRELQLQAVHVPEHPEYCGALGAALIAADREGP